MQFSKFFNSVLLAVLYASTASASPIAPGAKFATHRVREISPDLKLETFHPASEFQTFGTGIDHPLRKREDATVEEAAVAFVESQLGVKAEDVDVKSTSENSKAKHAYVQQKLNGVPVANAVANVAFNKEDKVVAFGSSFVKPSKAADTTPSVKVEDAIATAEQKLKGKFDAENFPAPSLEYLAKQDGTAVLTHVLQVRNEDENTWYEAFVDAHSGELVSVTDFRADAAYRVLPITKQDVREGFETLTDPQDTTASPQGWHSDGTTSTTTTAGNNVVAFKGSQSSTTSQSASGLQFIFNHTASAQPTTQANLDAARTNAFYLGNTIHDIAYKYGFTESTFNFQNNNFGKGGRGNDRVTISVQDRSGTNNANFATPPDGQSGQMRMFLWTITNPQRDGSLENDIVVHEYTHGITNRLTGGGTGRCLQTNEAGGMGEGWSDAFAEWTEQKSADVPDFTLGSYVINDAAGIRTHPYSTSTTTNPLRYSSIASLNEVHDIGEVWANILHNVYAALVNEHGFSTTAHTDSTGSEGNVVFLHLFIDALQLQPCNPTLLTARDSWIQADVNRFGGANKCTLWKAFASRGLGQNARNFRDDTTVPSGC
ncbi:Fungalysin metallopeptidase-domain-containing protein [Cristinia sonorae]|uniref:Extracellular metalloproteinase n=1 Tax=Cristinia sonorae TaxID=1940300 RepID=A0A8K0UHM6_9AGAR|nr:Fungalysin metallopeptidase-domain-containing protein [Cristinia sonorae]